MSQRTVGYIEHIAQQGDTFDALALAYYNEEMMASVIIGANPGYCDMLIFEGGEKVRIPVVESATTADTLPPWRR